MGDRWRDGRKFFLGSHEHHRCSVEKNIYSVLNKHSFLNVLSSVIPHVPPVCVCELNEFFINRKLDFTAEASCSAI